MTAPNLPVAERFWRKVTKTDGCWEWQAGKRSDGYGSFAITRHRIVGAHRFSWELHFGPVPDGLLVCHTCDNPPCVRPDHLFVGTNADNLRDRDAKGRSRGGRVGHRTLKPSDVAVIRVSTDKPRVLAARFGVSGNAVRAILRGDTWRTP